jgi:uncharacterized protein (DUF1330 family)
MIPMSYLSISNRDQAKARARELRAELAAAGTPISHSEALECVAKELGYRDWNTASARLSNMPEVVLQVGDQVAGRYLKQAFDGRVLAVREMAGGTAFEVTLEFDEPVDVVEFESFSNFRQRITMTISSGRGVVREDQRWCAPPRGGTYLHRAGLMAYLAPTQELGRRFVMRGLTGNVVMLNLIRLRTVADYSGFPDLAPESPVSGRAAYDLYIEHTLPYLQKSGGRLDFLAEGGSWLIGPEDERWDLALLVRQKDMETFFGFEQDPDYMKILGHRTAAVEDSRLLPLAERPASSN